MRDLDAKLIAELKKLFPEPNRTVKTTENKTVRRTKK